MMILKNKKSFLITILVLILAALGVSNDTAKDAILGGFSTMRGFTTLPVDVTASNQTVTGTWTFAEDLTVGGTAASLSADFEVLDSTATASLGMDGGGAVGSCLQLTNSAGALTYCRVNGANNWLCNTTSCK